MDRRAYTLNEGRLRDWAHDYQPLFQALRKHTLKRPGIEHEYGLIAILNPVLAVLEVGSIALQKIDHALNDRGDRHPALFVYEAFNDLFRFPTPGTHAQANVAEKLPYMAGGAQLLRSSSEDPRLPKALRAGLAEAALALKPLITAEFLEAFQEKYLPQARSR